MTNKFKGLNLIVHLYIFFGKMSIHLFSPFVTWVIFNGSLMLSISDILTK